MYCKNCGTELQEGALFCTTCGASLSEEKKEVTPVSPVQPVIYEEEPKKKLSKNMIILLSVVGGLLLVLVIVLSILIPNLSKGDPYEKMYDYVVENGYKNQSGGYAYKYYVATYGEYYVVISGTKDDKITLTYRHTYSSGTMVTISLDFTLNDDNKIDRAKITYIEDNSYGDHLGTDDQAYYQDGFISIVFDSFTYLGALDKASTKLADESTTKTWADSLVTWFNRFLKNDVNTNPIV